jgi:KaiC/GvpD/RAD55 family RecA-like ATPase
VVALSGSLSTVGAERPLRFRLLDDVEITKLPPQEWLIEGVLPAGSFCAVYGPPGVLKSFLAKDWSMCVATGEPWNGRAVMQAPVIYVAAEGMRGIGPRVTAWKMARGYGDDSPVGVHFITEAVELTSQKHIDALFREIALLPAAPKFIVFDTLARCFRGNENAAEDMSRVVAAVDRIRSELDATVLLIHHTRKSGDSERGSSVLRGALDAMVGVQRTDETLSVTCEKMKDAEEFERMQLRLVKLGESCVLEPTGTGPAQARGLSDSSRAVLALLQHGPMSYTRWCEQAQKKCGLSESTFKRARKELIGAKYVVEESGVYELTDAGRTVLGGEGQAAAPGVHGATPLGNEPLDPASEMLNEAPCAAKAAPPGHGDRRRAAR